MQTNTIVLSSMPHLEWMTENLKGFGGIEIDGRWYYTHEQAEEAVKQLGDGWRLPTRGEMVDLYDLGSTWDGDSACRWFGGDHDIDHEGSIPFPADGCAFNPEKPLIYVGTRGLYWLSRRARVRSVGCLYFDSEDVNPLSGYSLTGIATIRCVRNLK